MNGWFAMNRAMFEHPVFEGQPLRVAAWAWMLATAAWKDTTQNVNGKRVTVRRGQLLTSLRQMSKATGVPVQPLRTLLDKLKEQTAINTDINHGRLLITICNYEKYQSADGPTNTVANTAPTRHQHTKEQDKQLPPSEDASASAEILNISGVTATVWKTGKAYLSQHGLSEKAAGGIIGKWMKQAPNATAVLAAIEAAQKAETQDPVPYITATLSGNATKTVSEEQRLKNIASMVLSKAHARLTTSMVEEALNAGAITLEQCRAAGWRQ